jgi:2-polyprenyl-3-methyl-5-hydroxy-6-metoxy-1,4-benzoquinol methylase
MFYGLAPNFAERSDELELIDGSDYELDEFILSLADLRRVNRYLGGGSALTRHLFPLIETLGKKQVNLLDVGTGSADIPANIVRWGRERGIRINFMVLDLNEIAAREALAQTAKFPEIKVVRADALNLPFADGEFDFVLASMFLHHFRNPQASLLLKSFARVGGAFLINDLRRHPIAYYTIKLLTRVFTRNRLVRNDSAVSVLRGFTEPDIGEIATAAGMKLEIFRHFPYRFIFIGQRNQTNL